MKRSKLYTDPFECEKYEEDWDWMRLALTLLWLMLTCSVVYLLLVVITM